MLYEIINPSDAYTVEAASFEAAVVACLLLGEGRYSFKALDDGGESVPMFLFGGTEEWIKERFSSEFGAFIDLHALAAAKVLDSVLIGRRRDRDTYNKGLSLAKTDAERADWQHHWHDSRRTSMNDIGGYAKQMSKRIREVYPKIKKRRTKTAKATP